MNSAIVICSIVALTILVTFSSAYAQVPPRISYRDEVINAVINGVPEVLGGAAGAASAITAKDKYSQRKKRKKTQRLLDKIEDQHKEFLNILNLSGILTPDRSFGRKDMESFSKFLEERYSKISLVISDMTDDIYTKLQDEIMSAVSRLDQESILSYSEMEGIRSKVLRFRQAFTRDVRRLINKESDGLSLEELDYRQLEIKGTK
jgi:gas vesicle protein